MAALNASGDDNPYVRDVRVLGYCASELDGVSSIGMRVNFSGGCWRHSHPHALNVYDASYWAVAHPGNFRTSPLGQRVGNPIVNVSEAASSLASLPFVSLH